MYYAQSIVVWHGGVNLIGSLRRWLAKREVASSTPGRSAVR